MLQYSIHPPTEFIQTHLEQLLPSWSLPVLSVVVVLQLCEFTFSERTTTTEIYKDQLRERFIEFGSQIYFQLKALGHAADLFDPRTGLPMISSPGQLQLCDVKVVRATLGFAVDDSGCCTTVVHPVWGKAVYPSTLVSSAQPHLVEDVVARIIASNTFGNRSIFTSVYKV